MKKFEIEGIEGVFEAVSFGKYWNGWVTPVVTLAQLTAFVEAYNTRKEQTYSDYWLCIHAGGLLVGEEDEDLFKIRPDSQGNVNLAGLGFCFNETD